MLKILLQVKDKTKVAAVKWFVDANTVSVKEAREYKVGALTRPGPAFFEFALHVKAIYYANFTPRPFFVEVPGRLVTQD
jgi:hypothetical protein